MTFQELRDQEVQNEAERRRQNVPQHGYPRDSKLYTELMQAPTTSKAVEARRLG